MARDAIETVDYLILPDPADDQACKIRLTSGQYYGTEFKFGSISLVENEDDTATLKFDYEVIQGVTGAVTNIADFEAHIGWVLEGLLSRLGAEESLCITEEENTLGPTGNTDPQESADE